SRERDAAVLLARVAPGQIDARLQLHVLAPVVHAAQLQKAAAVVEVPDHAGVQVEQRMQLDLGPRGAVVAREREQLAAGEARHERRIGRDIGGGVTRAETVAEDRKSTRLNSSHVKISYAVFCLKKK